jgi:hypothetical protein
MTKFSIFAITIFCFPLIFVTLGSRRVRGNVLLFPEQEVGDDGIGSQQWFINFF